MTVLLLLAVVVLVLLNGFFVAAEFALVRVRRSRVEEAGRGGQARRAARAAPARRPLAATWPRASSASPSPRWASASSASRRSRTSSRSLLGEELPHGVTLAISLGLAYLITTSLHITIGEQVPKIYAINRAERVALWIARPLHVFTQIFSPFIHVLNSGVQLDAEAGRDPRHERVRGGRLARGAQGADRPVADRRQARRRRGADAHRRLPPARAAGAPGDDARRPRW